MIVIFLITVALYIINFLYEIEKIHLIVNDLSSSTDFAIAKSIKIYIRKKIDIIRDKHNSSFQLNMRIFIFVTLFYFTSKHLFFLPPSLHLISICVFVFITVNMLALSKEI